MSEPMINGHVVLPFAADWSTSPPKWSRAWQNEISSAVTGDETRAALRAWPRATLTFSIKPLHTSQLAIVDDLIRAAAKNGLACVPYHGRSYVLQADCTAAAVALDRAWRPALSGYLIFLAPNGTYDVKAIIATAGNNATLASNVSQTYPNGTLVWPLLFGKFTPQNLTGLQPDAASVKITIVEEVSPLSVSIGTMPAPGSGIGAMKVGSTFQVG
jgi:hypothetical protein